MKKEEKQPEETGTILSWFNYKNYGFIQPDKYTGIIDNVNLFFHRSAYDGERPQIGSKVSYSIGEFKGKKCAVNVKCIEEEDDD